MSENASLATSRTPRQRASQLQGRHASNLATVARPRLMRAATEHLSRDGLVALCSERGMGRHVLATDLAAQHRAFKGTVRSIRVSGGTSDNLCRRLRRCVNEAVRIVGEGEPVLIIVEGVSGMDDTFATRIAHSFEVAVQGGCQVLVIAEPEAETIFDKLPNCHVMRASELALDEEEYFAWGNLSAGYAPELVTRATHGIPALVAALKNTTPSASGMPSGPAWDRAVDVLIKDALRPSLIEEEQRLRCAMAALGTGEISELENVGIRVSRDLLEETALCAPIFGANARAGSFGMVPCEPAMIARTIYKSCDNSSELVTNAVRALAKRGDIARAASLASTLPDTHILNDLACMYPVEFIDAGLAEVLAQALAAHTASVFAPVVSEILAYTFSCEGTFETTSFNELVQVTACQNQDIACQVELLRASHYLLGHRETQDSEVVQHIEQSCCRAELSKNLVTRKLACHARVLLNFNLGNVLASFRELMVAKNLRELSSDTPSVFSAVLQLEFEAIRCLLGDPENASDTNNRSRAEATLLRHAPIPLRQIAWLWRDSALVINGTLPAISDFSRLLVLHGQNKEYLACAWADILSSCIEISNKSYKQAHVHANDAYSCAIKAQDANAVLVANLCKMVVLGALDGSPSQVEVLPESIQMARPCAGIEAFVRAYAELLGLVGQDASGTKRSALLAALRLRIQQESPEIVTFLRFVTRIDRRFGSELERALPCGVLPVQEATTSQSISIVPPKNMASNKARYPQIQANTSVTRPLLEIQVMGDVKVRLCGNLIGEANWRRSQAKIILAYLALKPEHCASRIELIDQLWPNADFQHGRESLYTTLSSLRTSIGQTRESAQFIVADIGRLSLDETLVGCDVDMFEALANRVQMHQTTDEEIIAQCLRLEALYGSGSFVPSVDATGFFKQRHAEVKRRFADVLLAGSEAATRLGDTRQASWLLASAQVLVQKST